MSDFGFKKRVLFIGIPDMAYVCLDGLKSSGVNIVGVMGAKKDHATYQDFKQFTLKRNLNFIEYDDLSDETFISKIKDLQIDIAVVCSFNYKIPKVFLDSIKDGFINTHPSLLPDYRGKNPYSTVISNGEKFTGVTLHFMDENWDTGNIIVQEQLQITPRETMGTLFNRLNFVGFELLLKVLTDYERVPISSRPQPKGKFKSCKNWGEDELFIDFNTPAIEIERFIRALNPFLVASSTFRNTFVKIYCANVVNSDFKVDVEPGLIVKVDENNFYILTKKGLLSPSVIQFGSFFTGTAKDFINMLQPKVGERWG